MAAVLQRPSPLPSPSETPPPSLSINAAPAGRAVAIPNKLLPFPSYTPSKRGQVETPPASPPSPIHRIETTTLLSPPDAYPRLFHDPLVHPITAEQLLRALNHLATQPLPSPQHVFPWLHGLHADNQLQLAFFIARKKSLRKTPNCVRGITVVKADGDLSRCRIKGAIAPEEILKPVPAAKKHVGDPEFIDPDPKDGFSVRNFQIQAAKIATVSDIVVYGDHRTPRDQVVKIAKRISQAQKAWQKKMDGACAGSRLFHTFVLSDEYSVTECDYPELIQIDSEGCLTDKVPDFFHLERLEMYSMSAPSEIAHNVWLGPTPDPNLSDGSGCLPVDSSLGFDLLVECSDMAQMPDQKALDYLEEKLEQRESPNWPDHRVHQLEFPGSGAIMPPTWSHVEVDRLLETCQWIYKQANRTGDSSKIRKKRRDSKLSITPPRDDEGNSAMPDCHQGLSSESRILIHCTDGYTETSLLALAYYMYVNCAPASEAWLRLHLDHGRNFFTYSSDVHLLRAIQPRLLQASPMHTGKIQQLCPVVPTWFNQMDGSLPSRILPYMYLGNLGHANNPGLLQALGIGQILSVGEVVSWPKETMEAWSKERLLFVDKVQDNGVDPLTNEFGRCLEFIENGRKKGIATLVHCRVGVSRSATICIAEVMNELGLSFPRAYCFVRARRLNVIIQPHLRFSYELLKWEEFQCQKRGRPLRRELEWATVCREIAAMNKPYSRQ